MKIEIIRAVYPPSIMVQNPLEGGFLISVKETITSKRCNGLATRGVALLWTNDIGPCSAEEAYKKWASNFDHSDEWYTTIVPMTGYDLLQETGMSFAEASDILRELREV